MINEKDRMAREEEDQRLCSENLRVKIILQNDDDHHLD